VIGAQAVLAREDAPRRCLTSATGRDAPDAAPATTIGRMASRLTSDEGREELRRAEAQMRERDMRRVAAMTVGERLERGLALSRAACEVRDAFASRTSTGGGRA